MNPILFDFGLFKITWYSIFILAAIYFSGILIIRETRKFRIEDEFVSNFIFWEIIFGIIGARIYYVAFNWSYYQANIINIVKIWEGGLAIHGGILAGIIFAFVYTRKYHISFFRMLDIVAVPMLLGQAIGRWGNFFNSEAHGPVVTRSFLEKIWIPDFIIEGMKINNVYYHPTFLYESLWCLAGFFILLLVRKIYKYLKTGQLTGLYFVWYGIGRFLIEILRTDSLMLGGLKMAQIASVMILVFGVILIIVKTKGSKLERLYQEVEEETRKNESEQSIDKQSFNI